MKTAIVTGSAGFIGGHIAARLLELGYKVVGIDNMRSGLQSTVDMHIESGNFIPKYIDITSEEIGAIFERVRPDFVFHLAAIPGVAVSVENPVFSSFTNINGTVNLLKAAVNTGVSRFVFSSSSSVYGGLGCLPTDETCALHPKSPYALQKKVGEEYCKLFSSEYGLDTVCLRYFNVFGPRQRADSAYAAAISSFCKSIKEDERPVIYGDGEQSRDFCFIKNVVNANILAAESKGKFSGDVFNVGSGNNVTINNVCRELKTKPPVYDEARPGDVRYSCADISKACSVLGYNPVYSREDGLRETLEWYLGYK
jgi:nucleoside-diphosphate-sugar epimerase